MSTISQTQRRQWITLSEAAIHLGVNQRTIRRYISAGRIKAYRLGGQILRIDLKELDASLEIIPNAVNP